MPPVLTTHDRYQDCMQRNLGKPSPDDMEIVSLEPAKPADVQADEEGTKYPFRCLSRNIQAGLLPGWGLGEGV